jgi:hypothetical protein
MAVAEAKAAAEAQAKAIAEAEAAVASKRAAAAKAEAAKAAAAKAEEDRWKQAEDARRRAAADAAQPAGAADAMRSLQHPHPHLPPPPALQRPSRPPSRDPPAHVPSTLHVLTPGLEPIAMAAGSSMRSGSISIIGAGGNMGPLRSLVARPMSPIIDRVGSPVGGAPGLRGSPGGSLRGRGFWRSGLREETEGKQE